MIHHWFKVKSNQGIVQMMLLAVRIPVTNGSTVLSCCRAHSTMLKLCVLKDA